MPLEGDRAFFGVILWVVGGFLVDCGALQFFGCVNDYAIEKNGDLSGSDDFAIFGNGSFKDDVVALPFPLFGRGIDEGWKLSVECAGLTVGVGDVSMAFHDLDFVFAH